MQLRAHDGAGAVVGRAEVLRSEQGITGATLERVLERLGFREKPSVDFAGLGALYRAWGRSVPFDNLLKLASFRANDGPFPGGHAGDFFAAWLEHGTGGTCWSSSNALYVLLDACGFDARRVAADMRDVGEVNHGSILVRVEGSEYWVDSSMLTDRPIPFRVGEYADAIRPIRIDDDGKGLRVWLWVNPAFGMLPCRLLIDPVDHAFYLKEYEASRVSSPFNTDVVFRRNDEAGVTIMHGNERIRRTAEGATVETVDRREALLAVGYSERIIAAALGL